MKRYTAGDYVLTTISFLGYAAPEFFVGLLLIQWFAIDIHLFPPFAPQGTTVGAILSDPKALVLPVAAFSFGVYALWSRYMRSSAMDSSSTPATPASARADRLRRAADQAPPPLPGRS